MAKKKTPITNIPEPVDPKPGEIWLSKMGGLVLVVEHPLPDYGNNIGYVWFDSTDGTMNFTPTQIPLARLTDLDMRDWGINMSRCVRVAKQENPI